MTEPHTCWACGGSKTTYALFSGGREYYCEDCDDNFPYEEGTSSRRVQMVADGRFAELRAEMHEHFEKKDTMVNNDTLIIEATHCRDLLAAAADLADSSDEARVLGGIVFTAEDTHTILGAIEQTADGLGLVKRIDEIFSATRANAGIFDSSRTEGCGPYAFRLIWEG